MEILGKTKDLRTNTEIIYAQIAINDYLDLIGSEFDEFGIQRKKEKYKAYDRMKADIKNGALLPTFTLAVKSKQVEKGKELIKDGFDKDDSKVLDFFKQNKLYNILDGLQRTYILLDIKKSGHKFDDNQKIHLEIWLEKEKKHLIYRLIVLNAGQKRMTLRHQLELLFQNLVETLTEEIPDLKIYKEVDEERRSQPLQFAFERIVTSYHCFLNKSPEIKKDNIVTNQLIEDSILDSSETELDKKLETYISYLQLYTQLDSSVFNFYKQKQEIRTANLLSQENFINCFFSSISDFGITEDRIKRISTALNTLIAEIKDSKLSDPLGISTLNPIIAGYDVRKVNVGIMTRKLLFNGFKEFFREEGVKKLSDCWIGESN